MTCQDRRGATSLQEALALAAKFSPERGIALFDSRGRRSERRRYPEILASAEAGAGRLKSLGVEPGERVIVCLPSSWAWAEAWMGALLLGSLPVAMAPPGALGASETHLRKIAAVADRLSARAVIAGPALVKEARELGLSALAEILLTPDDLAQATVASAPLARPEGEELAFLQLTSGSTGIPRAVAIPHRAVIHNNTASDEAIGAPTGQPASSWATSMVSWLPLHHDMGLVGCWFMSIVNGLDLWLFNPQTFLARPRLWLDAIADHGTVFTPAPNFGYQLCCERLQAEELTGLDLGGWKAALVGAEMVRPETATSFSRLTATTGFEPRAFRPCYGLAEGTLAVTFDCRGEGVRSLPRPAATDDGGGEVVSVGEPVADTELAIVAPDESRLASGKVGEVWVKGPGVFAGYYADPEATAETLRDGWLATGDLGFLADGELYLTGRIKDLLIIHGHNLMPHEIEWAAEGVTGGGGAERAGAFSIEHGSEGEQAVLVVETGERDPATCTALAHEIRLRVARALSLPLADIAFVRRGRIPKTTSGKVQRRELKRRYLAGELERIEL